MRLVVVAVLLALVLSAPLAVAATRRPPARVQVTSSEFEYVLSRTKVRQGRVILELVNLGEDPHDLTVRRVARGARTYTIRQLLPGRDASMSFRLYPGTYRLWCTIGDHSKLGMRATLTVTR